MDTHRVHGRPIPRGPADRPPTATMSKSYHPAKHQHHQTNTNTETIAQSPPTIGIIGLGGIGNHHARRFRQLGAEVVGMDVSSDACESFAQNFNTDTFVNAEALFEAADAVVVTTPNKFHEQYAVDALERGIDVLLEKPLARTPESAARIAAAERRSDAFCMVGFHLRFAGAVTRFKQLHETGWFGDLDHIRANYVRQRGIPGRDSWFTSPEIAGGGALIDIGVHALDLSLYLLGYPAIEEISGQVRSSDPGIDVDDSASAFIRCADGQIISLECAWTSNLPGDKAYRVSGEKGGATIQPEAEELTLVESDPEDPTATVESSEQVDPRDGHRDEAATFLRALQAGRSPGQNTVEEALTVQLAIDAIYASAEEGRAIRFDSNAVEAETGTGTVPTSCEALASMTR